MTSRISNIYCSIDKNKRFRFPEQDQLNVDPNKMAIAVSGGGTRSIACGTGSFRALFRKNPDFLKKISYTSAVSGGAWFTAIATMAKIPIGDLIGKSIAFSKIDRQSLNHYNFEEKSKYIGKIATNCPVVDVLLRGFVLGNRLDKLWNFAVSSMFLDPFGMDEKYLVNSASDYTLEKEFNELKCIFPNEDAPYWICGVGALDDNQSNAMCCEFTPMYSGIRVPNENYGGLLFSNSGFGCDYQELCEMKDQLTTVKVSHQMDNYIDVALGATSALFGTEAMKLSSSGAILGELGPKTRMWGIESTSDHEVHLTDGGFFDYTGVISLAARGCKKILAFLNCGKFTGNYCEFGITQLFGVDDEFKCYGCELRDKLAIFTLEDWIKMRLDFEARLEAGGLAYFHAKLPVQHNWKAGVNGGYETELLLIPLFEDKRFMDNLPIDLKSEKFPEFANFPNFGYLFGYDGRILELTNSQMNLLSTYSDWYLSMIMEDLPEFFEELNTE